MVLIVTALMAEAAPVIEHFKLKKDMSVHAFPVYRNTEIALIIGGVGKIKSAVAAVYLLSLHPSAGKPILLNIGCCGAGGGRYAPGSLLVANKITDMDTGRDYYPDVFVGRDLPKEALRCYSRPVQRDSAGGETDFFCDMESAGIMEVAGKFVYMHQVVLLKVISDDLTPEKPDRELLQRLLRRHMPRVEQIIGELQQLQDDSGELGLAEEKRLLDGIAENLRFSEAMKQMLCKQVRKAKQRGKEPLKVLAEWAAVKVNSKAEGKKIFGQISQQLAQEPV